MKQVRVLDLVKHGATYDCEIVEVRGRPTLFKYGKHYNYFVLVDPEGYHVQVLDITRKIQPKKVVLRGRYYAALHVVFVTG